MVDRLIEKNWPSATESGTFHVSVFHFKHYLNSWLEPMGMENPARCYEASSVGISNEVDGTYVYGIIFVTQNAMKIFVNTQYPPDDCEDNDDQLDAANAAIREIRERVGEIMPAPVTLTCRTERADLDSQSCEDEYDRQALAAHQAVLDKQLLVCHVEDIPDVGCLTAWRTRG